MKARTFEKFWASARYFRVSSASRFSRGELGWRFTAGCILGLGLEGVLGGSLECIIWGRFLTIFCIIHAVNFSLTNFSHFVMSNYSGCCHWFACLCVLGGGKRWGPVAKKCEKNENFEKYFFMSKNNLIFASKEFWEVLNICALFLISSASRFLRGEAGWRFTAGCK